MDRVCRSAACAEPGAIVDLEDELFALRYQWSEMLGNRVMEHSPGQMAPLVPGACVTDSKGLYDKMQHTVVAPNGKERGMHGFERRIGDFLSQVFWVRSGGQLGNSLTKDTEAEPFASFLRNGQRWRLIFDTRFMSSKKRGAAGISTPQTSSEEDLLPRDGTSTEQCYYT